MTARFQLSDGSEIRVWKLANSDSYWSETEGGSKRFHQDIDVLVDYLHDVIRTMSTRELRKTLLSVL